jgi:hypothetical protein
MNYIFIILVFVFTSQFAVAEYIMPGSAPKVNCIKAAEAAKSGLKQLQASSDSYVDRLTLIGAGDQRVWVVWFASPTHGYTIVAVQMNGQIRKATQKEINTGRGRPKK